MCAASFEVANNCLLFAEDFWERRSVFEFSEEEEIGKKKGGGGRLIFFGEMFIQQNMYNQKKKYIEENEANTTN